MVGSSLVFLTPAAGLVAIAAVIPLLALAVAAARIRRARKELRLPDAPRARQLPLLIALVAVVGLLALAATQPALRSTTRARIRTDAQAMFVIDISRSMLAAGSPRSATRIDRARQAAIALRAAIPDVPSGLATFTDRTVPSLFRNSDAAVFDATVKRAVLIEQPPPTNQNVIATSLSALGALGTQNYFPPTARRRLVVVLTDGESRPFDPRQVARQLATGPGIRLVLVHVWAPAESVYTGGQLEAGYRENQASAQSLDSLASASGGASFSEHQLGKAIREEKAALGRGPTVVQGSSERTRTLAPYAALAALLPLVAALSGGFGIRRRRGSTARAPASPRRAHVVGT